MMPLHKKMQPGVQILPCGQKLNSFPGREKDKVVIVMGATGTGKSRLSIDLATLFPAEIINSDKMQVYRGLDIVTNKITKEEQRGVPHHLLGILNPSADFTAPNFRDISSLAIDTILGHNRLPIIVGGSNSFIEHLVDDYDHCSFRSKFDCCFLWVGVSKRVDEMVRNGMVDEVRKMFDPNADYGRGIRRAIGAPNSTTTSETNPLWTQKRGLGYSKKPLTKSRTIPVNCPVDNWGRFIDSGIESSARGSIRPGRGMEKWAGGRERE